MKIESIFKKLNQFSELSLQEQWDNSGFQLLLENSEIDKILLALDITEEVVDYAIKEKFSLIISHHPLFFSSVKSVNYKKYVGKITIKAIRNNINIISLHTNIDKSVNGLADYFCKKIDLLKIKPLSNKIFKKLYKIVTFVPENFSENFLQFFHNCNIEIFDGYLSCSFYDNGTGTFYPKSDKSPFCGKKEKLNKINETRFEITVDEDNLYNLIEKIKKFHPYEIPVIDSYPLITKGNLKGSIGRIGELKEYITLKDLMLKIKKIFNINHLRYTDCNLEKKIKKIAVCPGSGMSLIDDVVNSKTELYITGDVKYHEALDVQTKGVTVIDLGHFNSEFIFTELISDLLKSKCNINTYIFPQKDIFKFI